jgi:hypothetical protein
VSKEARQILFLKIFKKTIVDLLSMSSFFWHLEKFDGSYSTIFLTYKLMEFLSLLKESKWDLFETLFV